MIKVKCDTCGNELVRSPSKVNNRNYCSPECFAPMRDKEIVERGVNTRMTAERSSMYEAKRTESLRKNNTGKNHPAWLGAHASYRAIHYWVIRHKGKPTKCSKCGVVDSRPRHIQWANVDGKYVRSLDDFIALCVSCHKFYDIALAKAKKGD